MPALIYIWSSLKGPFYLKTLTVSESWWIVFAYQFSQHAHFNHSKPPQVEFPTCQPWLCLHPVDKHRTITVRCEEPFCSLGWKEMFILNSCSRLAKYFPSVAEEVIYLQRTDLIVSEWGLCHNNTHICLWRKNSHDRCDRSVYMSFHIQLLISWWKQKPCSLIIDGHKGSCKPQYSAYVDCTGHVLQSGRKKQKKSQK